MKLVKLTPEGKIVSALLNGPKSFSELREETRLSEAWLSKKLKELASIGLVERSDDRCYRLLSSIRLIDKDPLSQAFLEITMKKIEPNLSMPEKAMRIGNELSWDDRVVAVILFGSVAKGSATSESDVDLLVVTEVEAERDLNDKVYELMFRYDVPVEAVFVTYDEFLSIIVSKSVFLFGLIEGYRVLYDRGGVDKILSLTEKQIRKEWFYDQEVDTWVKRSILPTWKALKVS